MLSYLPTRTLLFVAYAACTLAAPSLSIAPTVKLDRGTFTGIANGTFNEFLGIPFAKPPIGDLRFRLPVPNSPYNGTHSATKFGYACPQQGSGSSSEESEDCLTINVWAPAGIPSGTKLPVAVWIYGGGFATGSTSLYDGGPIVNRSIELGKPVIVATMNYRLSAFGFISGKEAKAAGVANIGLQDQRQALEWIQKYIGAFGGDPTKVTIWGESAGAISVALQMLTNNGNTGGLFRAGLMMSGSPILLTDGQQNYDALVSKAGCSSSPDTLACLRTVPYTKLKAAMDASTYQPWFPVVDGRFLTDNPQILVQKGIVAKIPFISGDCDDEGTVFSLNTMNITTDSEFRKYISTNQYFVGAPAAEMEKLFTYYPADPAAGSPFDTGNLNAVTPQFKRIAAIQGDTLFQAPRRFFLQTNAARQNVWSYLSKRLKDTPETGSYHGSDVPIVFGGGELTNYLIHFATDLNPNGNGVPFWPQYSIASPKMLTLLDGSIRTTISLDNFREKGMALITELSLRSAAHAH